MKIGAEMTDYGLFRLFTRPSKKSSEKRLHALQRFLDFFQKSSLKKNSQKKLDREVLSLVFKTDIVLGWIRFVSR